MVAGPYRINPDISEVVAAMQRNETSSLKQLYSPTALKTLVDALNVMPSYLSKRFVLKHLCGWTDEMIAENMRLKTEETNQQKIGDHTWR